jgi:hypothetical protein
MLKENDIHSKNNRIFTNNVPLVGLVVNCEGNMCPPYYERLLIGHMHLPADFMIPHLPGEGC